MQKITDDILYIGVNDRVIDLFESQFVVPNGIAYNSYVVLDDKITVFDTTEAKFTVEWLENLREALGGRAPDYLVVQHMEPDHSASITAFAEAYPEAKIVGSTKTFAMIEQFFGVSYTDRRVVIKDGDTLCTGKHTYTFVFAPMVHWPEVFVTYDSFEKTLFSADAFGKFGALDTDEEWACEARRYYFGIVGKYGAQVQTLLKKASCLDIERICSLHGPVLTENLGYYLGLYGIWSSYDVESEGIVIAYTSVYGNTKKAVRLFTDLLKENGCPKVTLFDLARDDMAEAVEDAFRYGTLVLATTTYNAEIFPPMRTFIEHLTERGYQNRNIALIENGSWAPTAAKVMRSLFEKSKNITFAENTVTIKSALNGESTKKLSMLAEELCGNYNS